MRRYSASSLSSLFFAAATTTTTCRSAAADVCATSSSSSSSPSSSSSSSSPSNFSSSSFCSFSSFQRHLLAVLLVLLIITSAPTCVVSMFEDEVGLSDFLLSTAGHGIRGVTYASPSSDGTAVITSSSRAHTLSSLDGSEKDEDDDEDAGDDPYGFASAHANNAAEYGCYVTSRSVLDGSLLWRRDVCSSSSGSSSSSSSSSSGGRGSGGHGGVRHAVYASAASGTVYTLDDVGTFRGWDDTLGALKFDVGPTKGSGGSTSSSSSSSSQPRLFGLDFPTTKTTTMTIVSTTAESKDSDSSTSSNNEVLLFRDPHTGIPIDGSSISAAAALGDARVGPKSPGGRSLSLSSSSVVVAAAARILGLVPIGAEEEEEKEEEKGGSSGGGKRKKRVSVLVGWVYGGGGDLATTTTTTTTGGSLAFVDVDISSDSSSSSTYSVAVVVGSARPVKIGGDGAKLMNVALRASSLRVFSAGEKAHVAAIGGDDVIVISADLTDTGPGLSCSAHRTHITELHPLWTSIRSIYPPTYVEEGGSDSDSDSGDTFLRVAGTDDRYPAIRTTVSLFSFDSNSGKIGAQVYEGPTHRGEEETEDDAMVRCKDVKLSFEYDGRSGTTSIRAYRIKGSEVEKVLSVSGNAAVALPERAPLLTDASFVLRCDASGATILVGAEGGTSLMLTATFEPNDGVVANAAWTAEEALGAVSSATFLDEAHLPVQSTEEDEEEALLHTLTFSSRLRSQLDSIGNLFSGGAIADLSSALFSDKESKSREVAFGFSKVALLLNSHLNVLLGSDVSMSARGRIRWTRRLPPNAAWHRVVHGGPSSRSGTSGGQDLHALHGHEVLVLSYVPSANKESSVTGHGTIHWTCLDGSSGRVHAESKVAVTGRVAQIMPLHSIHHLPGECRQVAALLLEDDSVAVVPDTRGAETVLAEAVKSASGGGGNGLYAHSLNRATGTFRSLWIVSAEEKAVPIGEARFRPDQERIVSVAYPRRNEVVQSPATILGDDSLLLKYLNPHLCVVVTEATDTFLAKIDGIDDKGSGGESDAFYRALGTEGKGSGGGEAGKTKPLGATKPGEDTLGDVAAAADATSKPPPPSLFVNVLDAASGRVLYRASHSHVPSVRDRAGAAAGPPRPLYRVPVVISENWIVYAYPNARTQRTDLGVLTLHEGMIDKTGITMVHSPDQDLAFSSLTSPRPIVLSKTFGMKTPVSALGVTITRGGISVKHVLAATGPSGSIASIDRRMLDPRRPTGEPKQSEITEGLVKYFPLLSITTKFMPSYDLNVVGVTAIESAAANVESQSLILAYGGPDVFFSRISPSKEFDLLPDNFNRPLLSAVVVGLLVVVMTLKGMSRKKMAAVGWT